MLLMSIILAVVIAALVVTAKRLVVGVEEFSELGLSDKYAIAVVVGLIVGAINYFSGNYLEGIVFLAPIFMVVLIGLAVWLTNWWIADGGRWVEMVPFIILVILFCLVMKAPAFPNFSAYTIPW